METEMKASGVEGDLCDVRQRDALIERLERVLEYDDDVAALSSCLKEEPAEVREYRRVAAEARKLLVVGAGKVEMLQAHKAALTARLKRTERQRDDSTRIRASIVTKGEEVRARLDGALAFLENVAQNLPVGPLRSSALDFVRDVRSEEIPF